MATSLTARTSSKVPAARVDHERAGCSRARLALPAEAAHGLRLPAHQRRGLADGSKIWPGRRSSRHHMWSNAATLSSEQVPPRGLTVVHTAPSRDLALPCRVSGPEDPSDLHGGPDEQAFD
jgi:hypothetical protein